MQKITVKDTQYNIIAFLEIKPNGDKVLKNKNYSILGFYDAATDVTKDVRYNIIGRGDILTTLLEKK